MRISIMMLMGCAHGHTIGIYSLGRVAGLLSPNALPHPKLFSKGRTNSVGCGTKRMHTECWPWLGDMAGIHVSWAGKFFIPPWLEFFKENARHGGWVQCKMGFGCC